MNERVKAILNFWFEESTTKDHFTKNDIFDRKIKHLFEKDYNNAVNNKIDDWQDDPQSCIALIILLDQFSRNLYRDNSLSYAQDLKVRLIANEAIDRGDLEVIQSKEKLFLILPLIHSENISDHIFAHNLCDVYLVSLDNYKEIKKQFNDHTNVIKKFKRYPHRNKILGRISTNEEVIFLSKENSSW